MKRFALGLFVVLLLGGCAESAKETGTASDKSPAASQTTAGEPVPDAAEATSPVDAEKLLASTLKSAKADNKRVMVHLGAPW